MDFTREPIIESVITPREGCKLVVRSSKGSGQEEYFVDAVEVVSFGKAEFLRCLERPKAFLLPVTDYEVLEVREPRMVLKGVQLERPSKGESRAQPQAQPKKENGQEKTQERRRDKRRQRKRSKDGQGGSLPEGEMEAFEEGAPVVDVVAPPVQPKPLIPPPQTLISETIARYRGDDLFKGVFFPEDEKEELEVRSLSFEQESPVEPRENGVST